MAKENNQTLCYLLLMSTVQYNSHTSIHIWRYSPFRALASLITRLHSSLCSALLLHSLIPSSCNASLWTTSAHLVLGLPTGLVMQKFPFKTFFLESFLIPFLLCDLPTLIFWQFPTIIHNNSTSAIDNIFNHRIKNENHTARPFVNGLPDHDAQIITIHNIIPQNQTVILKLEENLINTLKLNSRSIWVKNLDLIFSLTMTLIQYLTPFLILT